MIGGLFCLSLSDVFGFALILVHIYINTSHLGRYSTIFLERRRSIAITTYLLPDKRKLCIYPRRDGASLMWQFSPSDAAPPHLLNFYESPCIMGKQNEFLDNFKRENWKCKTPYALPPLRIGWVQNNFGPVHTSRRERLVGNADHTYRFLLGDRRAKIDT